MAQCRFCLEESSLEDLLAPCKCEGTGRFVHAACLRRWQQEVASDERAAVCSVCRTPFSLMPATPSTFEQLVAADDPEPCAFDDFDWFMIPETRPTPIFDSIRAGSRYDHVVQRLPGYMHERMGQVLQPGRILLQRPQAVESESFMDVPAEMQRRCHGRACGSSSSSSSGARPSPEGKGVYLLAATWPGIAADGSDVLLGVNLAGPRQDPQYLDGAQDLRDALPNIPLSASFGGPVKPSRSLCLVAVEGAVSRGFLSRFVQLVLPQDYVLPSSQCGVTQTVESIPSDSCQANANLGNNIPAEAATPLNSASLLQCHCIFGTRTLGALFGEPHHVTEVLALQPWLQPVAARVFQGHVVWSSSQLLCEVIGGSWGVAHATSDDILEVCKAQNTSECWDELWSSHGMATVSEAAFSMPLCPADACTEQAIGRPPTCLQYGSGIVQATQVGRRPSGEAEFENHTFRAQVQHGCDMEPKCIVS